MARQRRQVHFQGQVQGVGFRYTTDAIARNFDVTGYVQNLSDGRVRLVAEGDDTELEAFLQAVGQRLGRFIASTEQEQSPASGEFMDFHIRLEYD